jgi:hypothetical protein
LRVPDRWGVASNTLSSSIDVSESSGADASLCDMISDLVGRAVVTGISLTIPPRGRSARAVSGGIDSRDVRWAVTDLLNGIIDLVGGA